MEKKNLFDALLGLMEKRGSNNYEPNTIYVRRYRDGVEVQTSCRNEYGGNYANADDQFIGWHSMPKWVRGELLSMDVEDEKTFALYREDYEEE